VSHAVETQENKSMAWKRKHVLIAVAVAVVLLAGVGVAAYFIWKSVNDAKKKAEPANPSSIPDAGNLAVNGTFDEPRVPEFGFIVRSPPTGWTIAATSNTQDPKQVQTGATYVDVGTLAWDNLFWGCGPTPHPPTKNKQFVALTHDLRDETSGSGPYRVVTENTGPYIEQMLANLTPGSAYTVTVTAVSRFTGGRLTVSWDGVEISTADIAGDSQQHGPIRVVATKSSHALRVSYTTYKTGYLGRALVEEVRIVKV
jgi:hypothetical protein